MCPTKNCGKSRKKKSVKKDSVIANAALSSVASAAAGVPNKIRIRREKGYRTHNVGRYKNGIQVMGFIVGVPPNKSRKTIQWYAVVHTFDRQGAYLHTEHLFLGSGDILPNPNQSEAKLEKMIQKEGSIIYGDIEVALFSVRIDGHVFGLLNASEPEEGYYRVDLVPNELAFFPPWDGTYDT